MRFDQINRVVMKVDRKVPLFIVLGAVVVAGVITALPAQDQSAEPDAVRKRLSSATKLVSDDDSDEVKPETQPSTDTDDEVSPATGSATQPVGVTTQPVFPNIAAAATQPATHPATGPSTQPLAAATGVNLPQTNPSTSPVATDPSRGFDNNWRNDRNSRSRGDDRRSDGRSPPATSAADGIVIPPTRSMDKRFEGLLARSLFSKSRPPPPFDPRAPRNDGPPPTPPTVPLSPERNMALRGVSIEDGGDKYAFIEDTTTRQILRIKAGSKVARGTIVEVTLVDLVYDLDGKRTRITTGQTLEGTPAPANTWTTYQPVAAAVPPGGGQQQSFNGGRNDGRNSESGRGGRDGRDGNSQGSQPGVPVSTPAPSAVPGSPATAPAAPTTAPSGASEDSIIERMRRARQEGGR